MLRQLSGGVYHDPIAQNDVHLRIKYRLERIQKQLRDDISGEIPNYDDEEYSNRIQNRLMDMRGRELSGFISSRLLLSTVATDIEGWRIEVEKAFAVSVETFASEFSCLLLMIDSCHLLQVLRIALLMSWLHM